MEMIRAIALVWLFAGLRSDEIRRLRVGCIRWQQRKSADVCFLDVPVHKTGTAFTKPVDQVVGQAINTWEKVRPPQAKLCDPKTGEMVDFLFLYRMRQMATSYLNLYLIPRLCRKAGVPQHDLRDHESPGTLHHRYAVVQRQRADEPLRVAGMAGPSDAAFNPAIRKDHRDKAHEVVFRCWLFRTQPSSHRSANRPGKGPVWAAFRGDLEVL